MKKILTPFIVVFFITTISTSSFGQWVSKANALKKRSEVNSVVYNGKLYAFLGFRDSSLNVDPSAEVYDPALNTWKLLNSLPSNKAVTHQGVALIDDNVWHIGGRVGRHPGPLTSEIWIYDITNNSWSPGPQIKDPATGNPLLWGGGGAAFLGRTLHVFGGFIINACNNDQASYHLTLNVDDWLANPTQATPWKNELAPLPLKRNHIGTVVLGGKIYAIGGQFGHDCGGGQDKQYSHVYNPATNIWTQLPLLPTPRSHAEGSVFTIDGKIYLVAGQATNGICTNKVTIFNPAANNGAGSWADDNSLTLPKSYEGLSSKVINNTFIISHGGEGGSQATRNTTYSRTIIRNPVYKFGFSSGCANLTVLSGNPAKAKTLLFTIDGSKSYTTSSSASWLTVSKNSSGTAITNGVDIEFTTKTAGLAPGNYNATITATGTGSGPSYTSASYCVNLKVYAGTPVSATLEAELAVLNKAVVASNQPGFTGTGFVDYINITGDFIEWTLNKTSPGSVSLNFRYANGSSVNRPLKLEANGVVIAANLAFPPTGGWAKWSTTTFNASLISGANKIKLTATGSSGANIDHLAWRDISGTLEAELAVLNKAVVASNQPGFTGSGFADYINSTGDFIEWTLNKTSGGSVSLNFRYANGSSVNRPLKLEVNGVVAAANLAFPSTGGWANWSTATFTANLVSGANKIKLTAIGSSGGNIDHLAWNEVSSGLSAPLKNINVVPTELSASIISTNLVASVLPNPVSGKAKLLLKTSSVLPVEIIIVDISGKVHKNLFFKNRRAGYLDFSVNELPSGSYFIIVKQGSERTIARFVVEK